MTAIKSSGISGTGKGSSRITQNLRDLSIGSKLNIGFGSLVALFIALVALSYLASSRARQDFERTRDLRLPTALASAVTELEMHEMIANIQGYLTLGDPEFREEFDHDVEEVEELLAEMDALSPNWTNPENRRRLAELRTKIESWLPLTERMFQLRDDPVANQPARRLLVEEARPAETTILANVSTLIELQAQRPPTGNNMRVLKTIADYQSSFSLMTTALDGYLASTDPASKSLFNSAMSDNNDAWARLLTQESFLTEEQREAMAELAAAREVFWPLPSQMIEAVEGEHVREDFYLLRTQAAPLAAEIVTILEEMRADQMASLAIDVDDGSLRLSTAQSQIAIGAVISAVLAIGLAFAIRRDIAGPVAKLTEITAEITEGDLNARAPVESRDEIGKLAASFNKMTDQLKETLAEAERRSTIIATSSWISWRLSTILDQDQLIAEVVEQLKAAFDYYHVHIFLMHERGDSLVTAGGFGEAGETLLKSGFSIPLGEGLVGGAAKFNRPVLVNDVTKNKQYLPNPLLPETRSELAVPIATRDQVLGVLDVQHNVPGVLDQTHADMMRSIASQVAIALLNARSYASAQRRANREELINEISRKILSTSSVAQALQVSIRELGRAVGAREARVYLSANGSGNGFHPDATPSSPGLAMEDGWRSPEDESI
jgi:putative methionine-R-sulfoxide reductase with GAF domain/CHASE3 domain sensor protein